MTERVLYIFDDNHKGLSDLIFKEVPFDADLLLCPMTVDENVKLTVLRRLKEAGYYKIEILDYLSEFNRLSFEQREQYIEFIANLGLKNIYGHKNLKEYFKCPRRNWSFWWQSLIVEKNPLKSTAFKDLIRLEVILKFQQLYKYKKIIFNAEGNELAKSLADNGNNFNYSFYDFGNHKSIFWPIVVALNMIKASVYYLRIIFRSFFAKLILGNKDSHSFNKLASKYLFVAPFPFADKASLLKEKYHNKFFAEFQKELDLKKINGIYSFLGLAMVTDKVSYKSLLGLMKKIKSWQEGVSIDIEYLAIKDYIYMFFLYFYVCFKFLVILPMLIKRFSYFKSEKIWPIFQRDWMKSFCGTTLIDNLFYYFVFAKAFNKLNSKQTVIYIAENLGWEKMLNIAAKESVNLKTVGYQHTVVPLQLLNYFNHSSEVKNQGHIKSVPLPDFIGCTGNIPAELLIKSGLSKEKVFIWGSMRHRYLEDFMKNAYSWERRKNNVLVALPMEEKEAKEILSYACQAFKNQREIKVFIRGHYAGLSVGKLCKKYSLKIDQDIFIITREPLVELLQLVKVVVVGGSTVALEAIAAGAVPITPILSNTVDLNPLTGFSSCGIYVFSSSELKEEVDKIVVATKSSFSRSDCVNLIERYFYFLKDDETFLSRLEKTINSKKDLNDKVCLFK